MDLQVSRGKTQSATLSPKSLYSLIYHDIFDYPLTLGELIKWEVGKRGKMKNYDLTVKGPKNGFYFIQGRDGVVLKRLMRRRIAARKIKVANDAAKILNRISTIKMAAVTGALAMENASEGADIDFLIITRKGTLWTTRAIAFLTLSLIGFPLRRFGDKRQKDKLCLNMWLDEKASSWPKKDRNIYTAHEICQIIPLINKESAYEKFIWSNRWVKAYWPNAIKIRKFFKPITNHPVRRSYASGIAGGRSLITVFEPLARTLQFLYMRRKITREVVGKRKAIFHPHDWSEVVKLKLINFQR